MTPAENYAADGFYLHTAPILSADLVRRAAAGQEAICRGEYNTGSPPLQSPWNPGDSPDKLVKIEQPQFADNAVWEVVSNTGIGEAAAELTSAEMVQVWWVQMLVKPSTESSETRTNIGWHQDRQYWKAWEEGSELFTAWVALTDVEEDCGPMKFLRGSNHWGLLDSGDFYGQDLDDQAKQIQGTNREAAEDVQAILSAGAVSFHHCLTFHGSGPNLSGRSRRSLALHMRTEKSRPKNDKKEGLTRFIDDETKCPVIYRK
ncbi:MAG: phytanoyl-CoA dioxygenase family protein [Planctomycetota bacterium]|nr:phytanoyl-CoA dioxygenase family protein [Planctomycetota bacterium]